MNRSTHTSLNTMNRRGLVRLLAGTGLALAAGTALGARPAMASDGPLVSLCDQSIYSEASWASEVVALLGGGELVNDLVEGSPEQANGFRHIVNFDGVVGWVREDGLKSGSVPNPDEIFGEYRYVAHEDVMYSDAGDAQIVGYTKFADVVQISDRVAGDYILVRHIDSGAQGWIYRQYVTAASTLMYNVWDPEGSGVSAMMKEPRANGTVLAKVPDDAKVLDYDGVVEDGYYGVQWGDNVGWIHGSRLGRG